MIQRRYSFFRATVNKRETAVKLAKKPERKEKNPVSLFDQKPPASVASNKVEEFRNQLPKMSVIGSSLKERQKGPQTSSNNSTLRVKSALNDEKATLAQYRPRLIVLQRNL